MMYGSWIWSATDRFFLSSWAIFCPFTPLTAQIMKISKMKKSLEISSFYTSVPKIMVIGYTFPEIWRVMDVIVIQYFSILLPNNSPTNENKSWRYRHFIQVYQKSWSYAILFLRYGSEGCNYFSLSAFFLPFYPPESPKNQNFKNIK